MPRGRPKGSKDKKQRIRRTVKQLTETVTDVKKETVETKENQTV